MQEIKIAYIGGGSANWAYKFMGDLALEEDLGGELVLYDIDLAAAQKNVKLADKIFHHQKAKSFFKLRAEKKVEEALKGADFVVFSIEPGPTSLRYADLEIPLKYGILQSVGDTCGPGGLVRAMRAMPIKEHYAHLVMQHCPDAWCINYTNPMTLCTAALYAAEAEIKAFGCCHEVFGTQQMLQKYVKKWFQLDQMPSRQDIKLDIAGVNHFTVASQAHWQGHDLFPYLKEEMASSSFFDDRSAIAQQRTAKGEWFRSEKLIAFDFLRRFNVLGAAGDRHLAEFVPWYISTREELHRWGVQATPFSWRMEIEALKKTKQHQFDDLEPSGEEGAKQIKAILGSQFLMTNVNLPNRGQISFLPQGAVVESYAGFYTDAVRPIICADIRSGYKMLLQNIVNQQQLVLEAYQKRDRDLLLQALLCDALVHLSTDKAKAMLDEMLDYTKEYLPENL